MHASLRWFSCGLATLALVACAADSNNAGTGGSAGFSGSSGIGGTGGVGGTAGVGGSSGIGGVGGSSGTGGFGGVGGSGGVGGTTTCAEAEVHPTRIIPTVDFLIDGSRSMETAYSDNLDRWHALREALLDPTDGVVKQLDGIVDFGLVIYNDAEAPQGQTQTCPTLIEVSVASNNAASIEAAFPDSPPGFNTPTGVALDQLVRQLPDTAEVTARGLGPQIVILATDGEPYECTDWVAFFDHDELPAIDYASVVAAATTGTSRGVTTYVISVAEATGDYADHLNQVAVAGGSSAAFSPSNRADLVMRIRNIVNTAVSCDVALAGQADMEMDCLGTVKLNDVELVCNSDDGWRLIDPSHIRLTGEACNQFQADAEADLIATFPCGIYLPD